MTWKKKLQERKHNQQTVKKKEDEKKVAVECPEETAEMAQDLTVSKPGRKQGPANYGYSATQQPNRAFPVDTFGPSLPPQQSSDLTPLVEDYSNRPSPLKPSMVESGGGGSYPSSPSKLTSLDNPTSFSSSKLTPIGQFPPSNYRHTPSPRFAHSVGSPEFQRNVDSHYRPQGNFPAFPSSQGQYGGPPSGNVYGRSPPSPYPRHGSTSPPQEDCRGAPYPSYPPPSSPYHPVYPGQSYYPPSHHPSMPHHAEEGQPSAPPYPPQSSGNYHSPGSSGQPAPGHGCPYPYPYPQAHQPNGGFMIDNLLRSRNPEGGEEDDLTGVTDIVSYITQE